MQRLSCTWRQQKVSASSRIPPNPTDNAAGNYNNNTKPTAPSRRRLGRFAIAAGSGAVTSGKQSLADQAPSLCLKDKQESFLSSFSANDDLLEEMDKIDAGLNHMVNVHKKSSKDGIKITPVKNSVATSCIKPTLHSEKGAEATKACENKGLVKRPRNQSSLSRTGCNLETLKKIEESPTCSPRDKKQRLQSSLVKKSTLPSNCKNKVERNISRASPGFSKIKESVNSNSNNGACQDISFSPLVTTPNASPNSSDSESSSLKCDEKKKTSRKSQSRRNSYHRRERVAPSLSETPKPPKGRKRLSPKYTKSPVCKTARTQNTDSAAIKQNPQLRLTSDSNPMENLSAAKKPLLKQSPGKRGKSSHGTTSLAQSKESVVTKERRCQDNAFGVKEHESGGDMKHTKVTGGNIKHTNKSNARQSHTQRQNVRTANNKEIEAVQEDFDFMQNVDDVSMVEQVSIKAGDTSLTEDKRKLGSWGLPQPVLDAYTGQGVSTMFEWQAECLLAPGVLDGGNLVYSAPTSAGKTLVAELLVLKRVVETRKKALIILPFVSVAREKMFSLQRLYQDAGIKVGGYMGSYSPAGGLSALDVAVCTIEKGNGLVNRMMEDGRLQDIGIVVVDELHMIGDSHRGYLLELMLTKLTYMAQRKDCQQTVQIIGMSATLPNLEVLAQWLKAALYRTHFRPVPLSEHIKVDTTILDGQLCVQGQVPAYLTSPDDADHVTALCLETVLGGHSVLLFCPTKNWCEKLCEMIARRFYELSHCQAAACSTEKTDASKSLLTLTLNKEALRESIEQLRRSPVGVDPLLGKCLLNGVAYHHAGLTFDERDIVESAFRQGHLKALVATSTLSSGVNLPARRVIIRTPMFHGKTIDTLTYKQMSGRAGRKGVDTEGESILICKAGEKMKGKQLLQSELPAVESCLYFDTEAGLSRSLKRAILEVVVSGVANCPSEVKSYINCTLLSASLEVGQENNHIDSLMERCTKFLQDNEFVSVQTIADEDGTEREKFYPTQFGSAILASSMSPDEGILVFNELQKARRSFVLETDLHIIYLVTPIYTSDISASIDWYHYYSLWEGLTPADRRVADLVGVTEAFIARAISGRTSAKTEAQKKSLAVHQRFYTALVLNTLVQEIPLMEVATRFNLNKGQLQSLQQSAATYAGMVTVFSGRLGWHCLELILSNFQRRLSLGVQHELVDLVRISALNASSARMLYNAGYVNVADVAHAEPMEVENLFRKAAPFQSEKKQEGETEWERQERCRARCVWLTGRKGMTEFDAAVVIVDEAKQIVQGDVGVRAIVWSAKDGHSDSEDDGPCSKNSNGEDDLGGGDKENEMKENDLDTHSQAASKITGRVSRKSMDSIVNTPKNREVERGSKNSSANHFTQLKTRRSIENTPVLSSSRLRKKKVFPGQRDNKIPGPIPNSGSKPEVASRLNRDLVDNVSPLPTTPQNESSVSRRVSQGSGSARRWRSDKSLSKERSFFGQVVVSPPPGISPRNHQGKGLSPPTVKDSVHVAGHQRKPVHEKPASTGKDMRMGGQSEVLKDKMCNVDGRSHVEGNVDELRFPRDKPKVKPVQCNLEQDTISGTSRLKSKENIEKATHDERIVPHRRAAPMLMEKAEKNGSDVSPNIFGDDEVLQEERCGNVDPPSVNKSSLPNSAIVNARIEGVQSEDKEHEVDGANSFDCSFSGSFILDTQTVNIINHGVQLQSSPGIPSRLNQSCPKGSDNIITEMGENSTAGKWSDETIAREICEEKARLTEITKDWEKSHSEKSSGPAIIEGEMGDSSSHDIPPDQIKSQSAQRRGEKQSLEHPDPNNDADDTYSSLVGASNFYYEVAADFDEGMLEEEDEEDQGNTSCGGQRKDLNNSDDGLVGGTFDKVGGLHTPQNSSQASYSQMADDSLLAAVGMQGCYPLSPRVTVNAHADVGVKSTNKPQGGPARTSSTEAEQFSKHDEALQDKSDLTSQMQIPKELDDMEDDFFSDSLTASLVDQAFAQCRHSLEEGVPPPRDSHKSKTSSYGVKSIESRSSSEDTRNPNAPLKLASAARSSIFDRGVESPTSNNSSRNDDCIPPTPPDENLSNLGSPALRRSFLTPLKGNSKGTASKRKGNNKGTASKRNGKNGEEKGRKPPVRVSNLFGESKEESSNPASSSRQKDSVSCGLKPVPSGSRCPPVGEGTLCDKPQGKPFPKAPTNGNILEAGGTEDPEANGEDGISDPFFQEDPCPLRASQLLTQQSFSIIDVCAHEELFETFIREWKSQPSFALAVACEKLPQVNRERTGVSIGGKFMKKHSPVRHEDNSVGLVVPDAGVVIIGLAVSWENRNSYFLSLMESQHVEEDPNDSLAEPPLSDVLPLSDRIQAVCDVLKSKSDDKENRVLNVYDAKTCYIYLAKTLGISLSRCRDPRVADWLKEQGGRLKNLHRMVITFLPEEIPLLEAVGGVSGYQGPGVDVKSKISGRIRACTESVLTMKLMNEFQSHLEKEQLWDAFVNTEMPSLVSLARMEMNGFGINEKELESQKVLMTTKLEMLEQEAYRMAGHTFSLTSTDDIARVLYLELMLPMNGDPDAVRKLPARSARRRVVGGTGKEVLEKLEKFHTLPTLILEWRRISSALTKSLYALQKAARPCDRLNMMRVFGDCQIFSATGRVSLAEPNIQNIPKDFAIQLPDNGQKAGDTTGDILTTPVSMRKLFVPFQGGMILGADYSQLELRIIAHLSEDRRLIQLLNSDNGDVFKLIAAQMKMIEVAEVTPSDRQQAKQVCYGMLYGIGPKALGDQLGMCMEEASVFMETFKSKYPGVRRYLRETVEFCQKNGYVTTLFHRRRYLPAIKHNNPHARAHAERQAVNTSIQGSAADLVKRAMTSIDARLMEMFPDTRAAHSQAMGKHGSKESNPIRRQHGAPCASVPTGAFFVLQLHDELIYEVSSVHVDAVARLVKHEMENAVKLSVRFPVKVKVGPSWGHLEDYVLA